MLVKFVLETALKSFSSFLYFIVRYFFFSTGCDAVTMSGVPIETVDVNLHTLSELLRLYLQDKAATKMDWVKKLSEPSMVCMNGWGKLMGKGLPLQLVERTVWIY